MVNRSRLLADEAAAWTLLRAALDEVPEGRWDGTLTPEGWTPVTVLVHVAGWLDDCGRVLEAMTAGTWDPATDPAETPGYVDRVNATHHARAAAMTRSEAEVVVAAARERARAAFAAVPEVTPDAWTWFEESGPMHYAKHVHDLTAWLDGGQGDPEVGALLQTEQSAWVPFATALEAVAADRRDEPDPEGWTLTAAVHHLARWMELAIDGLRANAGTDAGGRTVDELNEDFLVEARSTSYPEARVRLEDARTALRRALSALPAPSADAKRTFVEDTTEHYEEHEPMVRRLLGGDGAVP